MDQDITTTNTEDIISVKYRVKINKSRLAEALNITPQAVYQWFKRQSLPSAKTLLKASEILGITPYQLINEIEGHKTFAEKLSTLKD